MRLTREEQNSLADLRFHWDDAYQIDCPDSAVWVARPLLAPAEVITAETAYSLREMLSEDYARRAARRQAEGGSL